MGTKSPRLLRAPAPPHERRLETVGRFHNLQEIFERLNCDYFGGAIEARITWGRRRRKGKPPRRHKTMWQGSYIASDRLITIHPALDRRSVPGFFVEFVVYHEMLHQKHPSTTDRRGRLFHHSPAFREDEAAFAQAAEARAWEEKNLVFLRWF